MTDSVYTDDISMIPHDRLKSWGTAACEWHDHTWTRYVGNVEHWDGASEQMVLLILCSVCGRNPIEALAALPVVVPNG